MLIEFCKIASVCLELVGEIEIEYQHHAAELDASASWMYPVALKMAADMDLGLQTATNVPMTPLV